VSCAPVDPLTKRVIADLAAASHDDYNDYDELVQSAIRQGHVRAIVALDPHKVAPGAAQELISKAARDGDMEPCVRMLLERGADANHVNEREATIVTACRYGDVPTIRTLMRKGAMVPDSTLAQIILETWSPEAVEAVLDDR
jgi:predicted Zn-dependent protease